MYIVTLKEFEDNSFDIDTFDYMGNACTKTISINSLADVEVQIVNTAEEAYRLSRNYTDCPEHIFIKDLEQYGHYTTSKVTVNTFEN